jgi:hypothetical protein
MNATSMNSNPYRNVLDNKIAAGARSAANVIERIHADVPTDQIAGVKALSFVSSVVGEASASFWVHVGENVYTMSDHALAQVAEKGGVPASYIKDMARAEGDGAGWKRELAARVLGEHYSHAEGRVLARSVRGQLRGLLSDRYRRIDSRPLVDALATEAQSLGAVPVDGVATDTRVALKVILPDVIEPVPGEFLAYGLEWSTSDYGNGTHSVRAFALRVACLNGMTRENLLRQIHLGGKLHEEIAFSDRTHRLDTAASVSALRDVVRGTLSPRGVEAMSFAIRKAADKEYSAKQLATAVRALPKADQKSIVDAYESADVINLPPGNTAWRASNAISWVARHTEDAEKRLELERAAGTIV